jgi:uncharacterized protein (TIGR00106 family)
MSVITEFAIFPIGLEKGLGKYIKKVVSTIHETGYNYSLTSMGTIFETETMEQALAVIQLAHNVLSPDFNRIYCTAKFDISKSNIENRMVQKVKSAS